MPTNSNTNQATNTDVTLKSQATKNAKTNTSDIDENRWVLRLEELLKVKNVDELKSELAKIASEVQDEVMQFDINAHLSSDAKKRVKNFEKRYNEVLRLLQRAQKDFDREFNKRFRVIKRAKQDAEKQIKTFKTRIVKHKNEILKASSSLKNKINKKTKLTKQKATKRRTTNRKTATSK